MGVISVGTDVVDVDRFRTALARTPGMAARLFTDTERQYAGRHRDPTMSLAGRFAVKEATMKALGVGLGAFAFHDVEVTSEDSGAPRLAVRGRAAELAAERGVSTWLLSMTHSDLVALAVVIAQ